MTTPLPEPPIPEADWQTAIELGALALHKDEHDGEPECNGQVHEDTLEGCRTLADDVLCAAMPVIWRTAVAAERERFTAPPGADRQFWGRIVRAIWVDWALGQPDPKPSWLTGWDELDDGQREVDKRIGTALGTVGADAERDRICGLAERFERAFREFVDEEEAADCVLAAIDLIRATAAADEMTRLGQEIQGGDPR